MAFLRSAEERRGEHNGSSLQDGAVDGCQPATYLTSQLASRHEREHVCSVPALFVTRHLPSGYPEKKNPSLGSVST